MVAIHENVHQCQQPLHHIVLPSKLSDALRASSLAFLCSEQCSSPSILSAGTPAFMSSASRSLNGIFSNASSNSAAVSGNSFVAMSYPYALPHFVPCAEILAEPRAVVKGTVKTRSDGCTLRNARVYLLPRARTRNLKSAV